MRTYSFPGGTLPSLREIVSLAAEEDFRLLDGESFRRHYEKTLLCGYGNFMKRRSEVVDMKGEFFARMWELCLCGCAAFHVGHICFT